jgi:hypothetical protein
MYDFHYNAVLPLYDNDPVRVRLCMTDTDSLLYHLVTEDMCMRGPDQDQGQAGHGQFPPGPPLVRRNLFFTSSGL